MLIRKDIPVTYIIQRIKKAGDPIASVGVWQSEDKYFEYATNLGSELQEYYNAGFNDHYTEYGYTRVGGDRSDLNAGAGSKTAYVYVYYKRAPHVKTQAVEYCYDGQPHNGIVTASNGATVTFEKSYTAIGSYNQVYKVTKDGMITISGDTPVKISNHDYSISQNNAVVTTCKAAGHETDMKCSKCGAIKEGTIIPKLEHTYKNLFCTACGALEPGYTKIKTSQTYYKIVGDTVYIDGKGEIPTGAFNKQSGIDTTVTKAVIGNSITKIGNSAFNACKSLTSVTIPNSVTSLASDAFSNNSKLTAATIPCGLTYYFNSNVKVTKTHHFGELVQAVPADCENTGTKAYKVCSDCKKNFDANGNKLASLVIKENGHTYENGICKVCSKQEITTGKCGDNAEYEFDNATGTLTISGSGAIEDNAFDSSRVPWAKNINKVIFNGEITELGIRAFFGAGVTEIELPNSVTSIGIEAFSECSSLESIIFSNNMDYIGSEAFADVPSTCVASVTKDFDRIAMTNAGYEGKFATTDDVIILTINGNEFTVVADGPDAGTGIVIVSLYDSENINKLLDAKKYDLSKGIMPQDTFTQSGLVKAMWWTDLEVMIPLCDSVQKTMSE